VTFAVFDGVDGVDGVVVVPPPEAAVTVAVTVALTLEPSDAVAVIVAVPAALPVTNPLVLTVATLVLLLAQVTVLRASEGFVVAESCLVAFAAIEKFPLGLIFTAVALIVETIDTSKSLIALLQPNWTVTLSVPV